MKIKISNLRTEGLEEPDYVPDEDETGTRFVEVAGKKYTLKFQDPHHFCKIVADKGRLPDELSGMYTTQKDAEKALVRYHSQKEVSK